MCAECNHTVGRKYHTTSRELDHFRDAFALSTDAMQSYALGSGVQSITDDQSNTNGTSTSNGTAMDHLPTLSKRVNALHQHTQEVALICFTNLKKKRRNTSCGSADTDEKK